MGEHDPQDMQAVDSAVISQIKSALVHKGIVPAGNDGPTTAKPLMSLDDERKQAETDDLKTDTRLKKHYARWFIGILIVQLAVMNLIFVCVGLDKLKFTDYVLHLYMGGTLAEVFGIVYVITRYLFPKR